jgi:hypothetical protein
MAAPPESNGFAFIVNRHPFPNPCLVHVSRVSKTRKENLDRFKPSVIHTPRSMNFILKPTLHNEESFNFHRQVLKESMLEAMTDNDKDVLGSNTNPQTLAVESVAKQEMSRALFGAGESTSRSPLTRRDEHKFNKIMSNWRVLRMKRLSDEHCLSNTFIADVKRSKVELKFIMKQEMVQTMKKKNKCKHRC